ncbi:hypothetical protein IFR05_002654 [Cadophora sp. M221]|nr:hypothetical protein IFR05_002654 [Cadophora sp. M221]
MEKTNRKGTAKFKKISSQELISRLRMLSVDHYIISLWENEEDDGDDSEDDSGSTPLDCAAEMGGRGPIGPPTDDSVRLLNWSNGKTMGTTASDMSEFEDTLSPRLIFNLLYAGGTATIYQV